MIISSSWFQHLLSLTTESCVIYSSFLSSSDKETEKAEASLLTKTLRTKLIENTHDVEVQRKDPKSPLYSVKSFEELRL